MEVQLLSGTTILTHNNPTFLGVSTYRKSQYKINLTPAKENKNANGKRNILKQHQPLIGEKGRRFHHPDTNYGFVSKNVSQLLLLHDHASLNNLAYWTIDSCKFQKRVP
ncbi:hypothetical protein NX059_006900 [Plenodomus lindquistii]|nr:hypothetical protein NX059_006900 [Plenodomus lindquistii]